MSLICPICQDNLINGESTDNYVNRCGHVYHSACLLPWWDRAPEPNCPECRQPCNIDTITKIFLTVDHSEPNVDHNKAPLASIGDVKSEALLRQIKEHIDVQTYTQTKDINDKFRQQNSDFSTLLLNSSQRLTSNYNDKLSAASKELTTAITEEHKRLLAELNSGERSGPSESYNILDQHSSGGRKRPKIRYLHIAATLCLISLITLIVVIVYSHLILNALHSTEHSGALKTNNISQRLDWLSEELRQLAENASRENQNIKLSLEKVGDSIGNGAKTQEVLKRLGEVSRRGDQLLLEQIQTDRKINLKLEVLENGINILKAQIEADKKSKQPFNDNEKLSELEARNRALEAKLQHLQTILTKNPNLEAGELRKQIENDDDLSPRTEQDKSLLDETKDLWHRLISGGTVKSSSTGRTVNINFIIACTTTLFIFQIARFCF